MSTSDQVAVVPEGWPFDLEDPYPSYAEVLAEGPVHWLPKLDCFVIVGYSDARSVLSDPRWSTDPRTSPTLLDRLGGPGVATALSGNMAFLDAPQHTHFRQSVQHLFTPKAVAGYGEVVAAVVDAALSGGVDDFVQDVARPIPLAVICSLFGADPETAAVLHAETPALTGLLDPLTPGQQKGPVFEAAIASIAALLPMVADRRASPRPPGQDLLSDMVAVLDRDEAITTALLLLVAGYETTSILLANGVVDLLDNPDELVRLRRDPSLLGGAVEELLRHETPLQLTWRAARDDMTLAGHRVSAGQIVLIILGAANRDPSIFPDPDRLDITRKGPPPLTFGHGIHYCLGKYLARLEGEELFGRIPAPHQRILSYRRSRVPMLRRVEELHLSDEWV